MTMTDLSNSDRAKLERVPTQDGDEPDTMVADLNALRRVVRGIDDATLPDGRRVYACDEEWVLTAPGTCRGTRHATLSDALRAAGDEAAARAVERACKMEGEECLHCGAEAPVSTSAPTEAQAALTLVSQNLQATDGDAIDNAVGVLEHMVREYDGIKQGRDNAASDVRNLELSANRLATERDAAVARAERAEAERPYWTILRELVSGGMNQDTVVSIIEGNPVTARDVLASIDGDQLLARKFTDSATKALVLSLLEDDPRFVTAVQELVKELDDPDQRAKLLPPACLTLYQVRSLLLYQGHPRLPKT